MTRSAVQCLPFAAVMFLGMGCASQSDSSARQVRELTDQVRRLQATTDRLEERLSAIEHARPKEVQRPPNSVSLTTDMPDLPVVKVNPESGASASSVRSGGGDADEPRPLIVGEGSRVETRASGAEPSNANLPARRKEKSAAEPATTKQKSGATDAGKKTP